MPIGDTQHSERLWENLCKVAYHRIASRLLLSSNDRKVYDFAKIEFTNMCSLSQEAQVVDLAQNGRMLIRSDHTVPALLDYSTSSCILRSVVITA